MNEPTRPVAAPSRRPVLAHRVAAGTVAAVPAAIMVAVVVALTGVALLLGYANKARCTGPEFDAQGRSGPDYELRIDRDVCYSDIQHLWLGRDIDQHVLPYVEGSIDTDGVLRGGTVEYPVLTGLLIWAGALGADTDAGFLLGSALLMAPFGLLTGWFLGRLAGWRALLWALSPPLVLYAFHNWDLPVVACAVGAVWVMHGWRTDTTVARRASLAAVLLGLGFAFKLYPGAFVGPLCLYVLAQARPGRLAWGPAVRVALTAIGTVVAVNLPFAVAGYDGWRASFTFQQLRKVDLTTNSIWFWGFRPDSQPDDAAFQALMSRISPALVLAAFAVAMAVGWWRWRRSGHYPWVVVSAAMLVGFLLLHKVHSPQYTLWLLPFFVLLAVPWRWVIGYLIADVAMGIGFFRWFRTVKSGVDGGILDGFAAQAVVIGVWGRAALLVVLFVVLLRLPDPYAQAGGPGRDGRRSGRQAEAPARTADPASAGAGPAGAESAGTEAGGAQSDGARADGTESDGAESDGAAPGETAPTTDATGRPDEVGERGHRGDVGATVR